MTVVISIKLLQSMLVIADARVSYASTKNYDDFLQKIYQIEDRVVLGFSGPISGALSILNLIKENIKQYSKEQVAANLLPDIERWIRYGFGEIKNGEDRSGLSFLLASIEVNRPQQMNWVNQRGERARPWFQRPEMSSIVLRPSSRDSKRMIKETNGLVQAIGISHDTKAAIVKEVQKLYGFSFKQPKLQSQAIVDYVRLTLLRLGITGIGGLFPLVLLSNAGVEWLSSNSPSDHGDVSLIFNPKNKKYYQINNIEGTGIPLLTIWEFDRYFRSGAQPGAIGTFEDPTHNYIVNRSIRNGTIET